MTENANPKPFEGRGRIGVNEGSWGRSCFPTWAGGTGPWPQHSWRHLKSFSDSARKKTVVVVGGGCSALCMSPLWQLRGARCRRSASRELAAHRSGYSCRHVSRRCAAEAGRLLRLDGDAAVTRWQRSAWCWLALARRWRRTCWR